MSTKFSANAPAKSLTIRDPNYVERIRTSFGTQGFLRHVDARIEDIAPGRCVIVADFRAELAQQNGYFHGGLIGTIADAAGACAAATLIESRQYVLTAEYKINFLALPNRPSSRPLAKSPAPAAR
jgi:acyl-coenzyme A thioesterase PaaI-like protein